MTTNLVFITFYSGYYDLVVNLLAVLGYVSYHQCHAFTSESTANDDEMGGLAS